MSYELKMFIDTDNSSGENLPNAWINDAEKLDLKNCNLSIQYYDDSKEISFNIIDCDKLDGPPCFGFCLDQERTKVLISFLQNAVK